jgi:hypothetical protein
MALTTVSTMQEAIRGLHRPQRWNEEVGWASHQRTCSCTKCANKRVVRKRMYGGGLAPIRAPNPRRTGPEDPRVRQLLSAVRPKAEVAFARELLSGWVSQAVDALDTSVTSPSTKPLPLPELRSGASQLPEAKRPGKPRPAARMAACPLLASGGGGDSIMSSHPGFADTTDYSQEQFGQTAVALWRAKEREEGSYEARSLRESESRSPSAERYRLPAIANVSTVSFANDTTDYTRAATMVVREERRQKARMEALQKARVADDAAASPRGTGPGRRNGLQCESDYMLAGCVCTTYKQQSAAGAAAPAMAGPGLLAVVQTEAAAAGRTEQAADNTEWTRPPPSKFDQKQLPSVGV